MAQPRRHGLDWNTTPVPATGARRAPVPSGLQSAPQPLPIERTLPTHEVQLWLNTLAPPEVGFMTREANVRYDHSLDVNGELPLLSYVVPQNFVDIIIELDFYARVPGTGLQSTPVSLPPDGLQGLLRFAFRFPGISRLAQDASRMDCYVTPGQTANVTPGISWLEIPVGPSRVPSFGLFARSGENVEIKAVVQQVPRFRIDTVGVRLQGARISEQQYMRYVASAQSR